MKEYINEQFIEMLGLGYSFSAVVKSLEDDLDIDQDVLKDMLKSIGD